MREPFLQAFDIHIKMEETVFFVSIPNRLELSVRNNVDFDKITVRFVFT